MEKPKYPREHLHAALAASVPEWLEHADLLEDLGELVDQVFFASLATEEGENLRFHVVVAGKKKLEEVTDTEWPDVIPEEQEQEQELAWTVMRIEPHRVDPKALVKLAGATEFGRTALVLDQRDEDGQLWIAGVARRNPRTNGGRVLVVSTSAPGAVSVYFEGRRIMRYERGLLVPPVVDVFSEAGVVTRAIRSSIPEFLARMKNIFISPHNVGERVFSRLVRGMRATGHGGSVLVLPAIPEGDAAPKPKYRPLRPDVLSAQAQAYVDVRTESTKAAWGAENLDEFPFAEWKQREDVAEANLEAAVDDIARLTAPDGALLMGPEFAVLGAGYMVTGTGTGKVLDIFEAFDAEGKRVSEKPYALEQHGARHKAAATFVSQSGGFAFVASEDGPLKVLVRHEERILLWRVELPEY